MNRGHPMSSPGRVGPAGFKRINTGSRPCDRMLANLANLILGLLWSLLPGASDASGHRHAAKTHLSRLIEAALACGDVVIVRGSTPVVRLVPVARHAFQVGLLAGQLGGGRISLVPLDEVELDPWEGGR